MSRPSDELIAHTHCTEAEGGAAVWCTRLLVGGRPLHEHYTDHYSERDRETDVIHNVTGISMEVSDR